MSSPRNAQHDLVFVDETHGPATDTPTVLPVSVALRHNVKVYRRVDRNTGEVIMAPNHFVDMDRCTITVAGSRLAAPDEVTQLIGDLLADFRFATPPADAAEVVTRINLFLAAQPSLAAYKVTARIPEGKSRRFVQDAATGKMVLQP